MEILTWDKEREARVSKALGIARDWLAGNGQPPSGPDIVFQTIKNMIDIHRRMYISDRSSPSTRSGFWPGYLHTLEEQEELFKQRMIDVAAGDPIDVVFGFRTAASTDEMEMAEAIDEVFRSCLIGEKKARDWKILHLLAGGKTVRAVAKQAACNFTRVSDRKIVQCMAIWRQVGRLLPPAKVVHLLGEEAA